MTYRFRRGNSDPQMFAVDSAVAIAVGDMVRQVTDDVRPAGYDSNDDGTGDIWTDDLATSQALFRKTFMGVSGARSQALETDPVRILRGGCFEFACAAATFEIDDLVGPAKATGNNLESQKVVAVSDPLYAIGRVAERYASNTTKVKVDLLRGIEDVVDSVFYNLANLAANADLAETHIFTFPFAAELLDVLVTPEGSAVGVDDSNTSVWLVKKNAATVVSETFDSTTTFPADNTQTSLGAVANNYFAAGDVMTLTVTNGTTADLPPCQVAFTFRKAG